MGTRRPPTPRLAQTTGHLGIKALLTFQQGSVHLDPQAEVSHSRALIIFHSGAPQNVKKKPFSLQICIFPKNWIFLQRGRRGGDGSARGTFGPDCSFSWLKLFKPLGHLKTWKKIFPNAEVSLVSANVVDHHRDISRCGCRMISTVPGGCYSWIQRDFVLLLCAMMSCDLFADFT